MAFKLNTTHKRTLVKVSLALLSLASFSFTAGFLNGILSTPLPLLSNFTVKDLVAVVGFVGVLMLHNREV